MIEFKKPFHHNISITPVYGGVIVQAGCGTKVYTDVALMLNDLRAYALHPDEVYKDYASVQGMADPAVPQQVNIVRDHLANIPNARDFTSQGPAARR